MIDILDLTVTNLTSIDEQTSTITIGRFNENKYDNRNIDLNVVLGTF